MKKKRKILKLFHETECTLGVWAQIIKCLISSSTLVLNRLYLLLMPNSSVNFFLLNFFFWYPPGTFSFSKCPKSSCRKASSLPLNRFNKFQWKKKKNFPLFQECLTSSHAFFLHIIIKWKTEFWRLMCANKTLWLRAAGSRSLFRSRESFGNDQYKFPKSPAYKMERKRDQKSRF